MLLVGVLIILFASLGLWYANQEGLGPFAAKNAPRAVKPFEIPGLENAHAMYRELQEKVDLLNEHLDTYFISLSEAGLSELNEICEAVSGALMAVETFIEKGNNEDALALSTLLLNPAAKSTSALQRLTQVNLSRLGRWEERSDKLIFNCVERLSQASEQNRSLGVSRTTGGGQRVLPCRNFGVFWKRRMRPPRVNHKG